MSVPDQLAGMGPRQLQELRARAALDAQASSAARQRLNDHIRRAAAAQAAKN